MASISDAAAGSQTFRGLVDQIGRTDGIVYVMEGQCQHGVRACLLLSMTVMGANRVLWIRIDPRKVDRDLMGSIGHELQHALEVLSHSSIRSGSAMTLLYNKEGSKEGGHFETDAAIKAGNAVRDELGQAAPPGSTDRASDSRVRTSNRRIAELVHDGAARSPTFKRLIATIEQSDGLIYLSEGSCGIGMQACLLMLLDQAGPNRMLRIRLTEKRRDDDTIASIGHELRHALEVLSDEDVKSTEDMYAMYQRIGLDPPASWLQNIPRFRFETAAAITTGNAIREELRRNQTKRRWTTSAPAVPANPSEVCSGAFGK
ncbi:MAG TPA: hypothetical protein VFU28_06695 [Vicinamibacterales bacterium]|nr:hypothetical protein [Vicinamibacterales bacterium]